MSSELSASFPSAYFWALAYYLYFLASAYKLYSYYLDLGTI